MNIKTLLLGSVLTLGSLFTTTSEVKASTCFTLPWKDGGAICNSYKGQTRDGYSLYHLGYAHGRVSSKMNVVCDGPHMVRWQSQSYGMSHDYNETLANYFCGL